MRKLHKSLEKVLYINHCIFIKILTIVQYNVIIKIEKICNYPNLQKITGETIDKVKLRMRV